jgi:AcrR family transcriptional regulator
LRRLSDQSSPYCSELTVGELFAVATTVDRVGYKHTREDILDAAIVAAFEHGLNQLSFGRLAARMEIADRTIVYYFPTKETLIVDVLEALAARLMSVIDIAFGETPLSANQLAKRAWPEFTTPEADRVFRVFFEVVGLAAARVSPYNHIAPTLLDGWVSWLAPRIKTKGDARSEALALVAKLDGLLLVRHTLGHKPAEAAASALGL